MSLPQLKSATDQYLCNVADHLVVGVDRVLKMPLYALQGVQYLWLLDSLARTLRSVQKHGR